MSQPAFNIDDLSPEERLVLLERLWDSLTVNPEAVPLTPAQRTELDRRLDEMDRGDVAGIPWAEVLRQIRGRVG
jgi:putative addiction module component (TIGR02574 family)